MKLQSFWRMHRIQKRYLIKRQAIIGIQRFFRAFAARRKFINNTTKRINDRNYIYFSNQAKTIQRYYRGYYCRKYIHDFYARKNYLKFIQVKNEEVREQINNHYKKLKEDEERRREHVARAEFTELAKNLHHLTSTNNIPGVYNPPFARVKPAAFDVDIETHLKSTFQANYKWRPPDRKTIDLYKRNLKPTKLKPLNASGAQY
eukprot:TRINITY_DN7334_c0_g1_i1.p1 TRINITY_DN7334_c0_g1~~TRINITY_DN7334_c0_g1_i1.p1  ORF type:complete len:203 (+),score=44.34 TRINITY_DN7334_c0_g1_i1:336-944(+)